MPSPSEIAKGLSSPQREAIQAGKWNFYPGSVRLIKLGIAERLPEYYIRLTPLGLAVRDILKEQDNAG